MTRGRDPKVPQLSKSLKAQNSCLKAAAMSYSIHIMIWKRLNGRTVPPFKMHPGGTVPPFNMHPGGTVPPFKMHSGDPVPQLKMDPGGTLNF